MKYLYSVVACLFMLITASHAQIGEEVRAMSEGLQKAMVFQLPGADKGKTEDNWKDFMEEYGEVERNRRTKEYVTTGAIIPAIHDTMPLTIYASFDEYVEMTKVFVWIEMDDRFINSEDDPEEIRAAHIVLDEFSIQVQKDVLKDILNDEEKELKSLQRDLKRLVGRLADLEKDIEKARETIRKSEAEIEDNIREQEAKKTEIEEQKERVQRISDELNEVAEK